MGLPMPSPDMLRDPARVLEQIRKGKFVDVLTSDMRPDTIHHKHFQTVAVGTRQDAHMVAIDTWISSYLLPVQFETEAAAIAFAEDVAIAHRSVL
jgi:hypothetical protein